MQPFQININEYQHINCSLYAATGSDRIIIIVSAAGVLQSFYKKLAEFFQSSKISTITFDFTGIGKSLQGNIKNENSSLTNWGNRDLEAVIKHATKAYPNQKLILLGHSIGGQLIGLAPSSRMADKIILVAAQSGYWRFWKGFNGIKMWVNWHLLVPVLTNAFGYFPSKKLTRMESLPKNIANEWAKWCRSRDYLFANVSYNQLYFNSIKCQLSAISIDDDFFAPKKSVDWLTAKFEAARIKKLHLSPKNFEVSKIGHFSLFTEKFRDSIWNILLEETHNQEK